MISDPTREACDLGANIQWYDDRPPAILEEEALFADKAVLARTTGSGADERRANGRPGARR